MLFLRLKNRIAWAYGRSNTWRWKSLHVLRIVGPPSYIVKAYRAIRPLSRLIVAEEHKEDVANLSARTKIPKRSFTQVYSSIPQRVHFRDKLVDYDFAWAIGNSIPTARQIQWIEGSLSPIEGAKLIEEASSICQSGHDSILIFWGIPIETESLAVQKVYEAHKSGTKSRTIVFLGDLRKTRGLGQLLDFVGNVDLVIHFNPLISERDLGSASEKTLLWPGLPYPEEKMRGFLTREKKQVLSISGQNYRYRSIYSDYCGRHGLPLLDAKQENKQYPFQNFLDYLDFVSTAQIMFANGYMYPKESILVGKVIEAILTGTTVLYESGSWIDRFFIPYEHYVPVYNRVDLLQKSRYLLENPQISKAIAKRAHAFYLTTYSSEVFWSQVHDRLEFTKPRT